MHVCPGFVVLLFVAYVSICTPQASALDPNPKAYLRELGVNRVKQEFLEFELVLRDSKGDPVEGAEVKPWALYSSLGHSIWRKGGVGNSEPKTVTTDVEGRVTVVYPRFALVSEQIATTSVTVSVGHKDHPYVSHEDVKVPCEKPHSMSLPVGSAVEVAVLIDGKPTRDDDVLAITTGGRSWMKPGSTNYTEGGALRIPPMAKGAAQFMLLKLVDGGTTHFSSVENVEIDGQKDVLRREVELLPAVQVRGSLSDNVPRPVKNGRVKVETISEGLSGDEINWFTWAEVEDDGTFVIDQWPSNVPLQLIALCDGFIAKSGEKPMMV